MGIGSFVTIDACENLGGLGNTRQALVQHFRIEMFEVKMDVVLLLANTPALTDFQRHGA